MLGCLPLLVPSTRWLPLEVWAMGLQLRQALSPAAICLVTQICTKAPV